MCRRIRSNARLGARCIGALTTGKKLSDHCRDGFRCDSTRPTVVGLKPSCKVFGALARVARDAASGNVLARDDPRVIDDVFPRRRTASRWSRGDELHAAVDTAAIPLGDFTLQPVWDVPPVHGIWDFHANAWAPNV